MSTEAGVLSKPRLGALSLPLLWQAGSHPERGWTLLAWLVSTAASIILGMLSVIHEWSGIPLHFAGVDIYITVYPPHIICLFWALCFGWWWGAIPAFLATLCLALYSGMPPIWALLFACSDPLGFALMTVGYNALPVSRRLNTWPSLAFFINLSFVSSIFSSSGGLIWCYTNAVDSLGVLPVWQGWWLGAFLQSALVVGPLLYLSWPAIEAWQTRRSQLLVASHGRSRSLVLSLLSAVVAGVLIYGFISIWLSSERVRSVLDQQVYSALADAAGVMMSTVWVFYSILVLIVSFSCYFAFRLFMHWQTENRVLLSKLEQANQDLAALSRLDGLTGLLNRRVLDDLIHDNWARCLRLQEPASLLMIDIDHFKAINDNWGHVIGDDVLRVVSAVLSDCVRTIDLVGRYGGEEFVIILPGTNAAGADLLAQRVRSQVTAASVAGFNFMEPVTVSIGVAEFDRDTDTRSGQWLQRADSALYRAKQAGRNRVVVDRGDAHIALGSG